MRREDKVKHAKAKASNAKVAADHARYFRFLDELRPVDSHAGAWIDPLMEEFGIGLGEASAAHLHWLVLAHEDATPEERAKMMGGM